jgi:hypothetical protein
MSLVCHRIYQKPAGSYRFYFNMGSGAETVNMQAGWISAKFFPTALGPTTAPQSDPQLNFGESARPASEQVKP